MRKNQNKSHKLPKGVDQTFVDIIQALPTDDLKKLIVELQLKNQDNEEFKESPEFQLEVDKYTASKARYQLVAGPIKDLTVSIKNKTKLIIERLKEKGGA